MPFYLAKKTNASYFCSIFLNKSILLSLMLLLFIFASTWYLPISNLKGAVDDEKVWQEIKVLSISSSNIEKLITEIIGIKSKSRNGNPCVQYVLEASLDGFYPCFHSEKGRIFLRKGDVWKIGKTCLNEKERYPTGYSDERLLLIRQFEGTAEQCLMVEKIKLYAYLLSNENQNRNKPIKLPPGNKIYR